MLKKVFGVDVLGKDEDFDDDFDEDFDDIDDEDSDDREYVTLDMEKEDGSKEEEAAQEAEGCCPAPALTPPSTGAQGKLH